MTKKENVFIQLKALAYLILGLSVLTVFFKGIEILTHYPKLFIGLLISGCLIAAHQAIVYNMKADNEIEKMDKDFEKQYKTLKEKLKDK